MHLSTRVKALLALVVVGFLGGVAPFFMKVALKEFNSYQILFLRFAMATLTIIPLLISQIKTFSLKKIKYVIPSGLLFTSNVFFFVVGVQYTTTIVSQLFYLLAPVIVSLLSYFLFREKVSVRRIISMVICFGGSSLLVLRSVEGGALIKSIGTFHGNVIILCAVISWAVYAVYTKKVSKIIEPSFFLVSNFVIALVISMVSLLLTKTSITGTIILFSHSSLSVMGSLVTLATINSILFFFLYQWSIKHVSAFLAASTAYLSPLSTALLAIPFLGEQLSTTFLISAASIFIGSYLILSEKK